MRSKKASYALARKHQSLQDLFNLKNFNHRVKRKRNLDSLREYSHVGRKNRLGKKKWKMRKIMERLYMRASINLSYLGSRQKRAREALVRMLLDSKLFKSLINNTWEKQLQPKAMIMVNTCNRKLKSKIKSLQS
jgi:hypothetical protein